MHLFVYPYDQFKDYVFINNVHFIVVNVLFLMAAFMNPGVVDKAEGLEFSKLVEKSDPNSLCPHCETSYTKDSRHCYICNQCVHRFDHHCQWINNCVGRNNHLVFYGYITTLLVYFIRMIMMSLSNIDATLTKDDFKHVSYDISGVDV